MASIQAVLRKKKNPEGKYPLAVRITKDRKSSYIYIGQYISENEWDKRNRVVKKSHPNSARLNNTILKKLSEVNDKLLEAEGKNEGESVKRIKAKIKTKGSTSTFNGLSNQYLKNLEISGKYSTYLSDRSRINHFKTFIKNEDLAFSEITELLLKKFMAYLKSEEDLSERSIVNNMIVIRTLFNRAIREGIVDQKHYPFGKILHPKY